MRHTKPAHPEHDKLRGLSILASADCPIRRASLLLCKPQYVLTRNRIKYVDMTHDRKFYTFRMHYPAIRKTGDSRTVPRNVCRTQDHTHSSFLTPYILLGVCCTVHMKTRSVRFATYTLVGFDACAGLFPIRRTHSYARSRKMPPLCSPPSATAHL